MKRERRDHFAEIRATTVDDQPGVTLHAIRPGVVDDFGSLWMADTFDKSLGARMPTLCWSHDWTEPLGPPRGYRSSPDGPEIDFLFSDFDAVPTARRAYAQVQDGTIEDCSVGFSDAKRRDPTDEEIAQYPGIREVITEATLDEVSLVLRGAVPGAKVLAVRSQGEPGVTLDDVVELAKRKASGDMSLPEARAALELLEGRDPMMQMMPMPGATDADESVPMLALAIDAALDSAIACAGGVDVTTWPPEAQQMFGNVVAAEAAVDALLDALGVADPDDDDGEVATTGQLAAPTDEERDAPVEDPEPEPDIAALEALVSRTALRSR